ncbi:MAG: hypothetical protein P8Y81_08515 [Ignavibacteriaceae bacterium]
MKKSSTAQFILRPTELEEIFLYELCKQNWLTISISTLLSEELIISLQ